MGLANAAAVGVGFRRRRGKVSPWASRGAVTPPRACGGLGGGLHSPCAPCGRVPFAAAVRAAMPMAARRAGAGDYQIPLVIVTFRDVFHRFFNRGGVLPLSLRVCA